MFGATPPVLNTQNVSETEKPDDHTKTNPTDSGVFKKNSDSNPFNSGVFSKKKDPFTSDATNSNPFNKGVFKQNSDSNPFNSGIFNKKKTDTSNPFSGGIFKQNSNSNPFNSGIFKKNNKASPFNQDVFKKPFNTLDPVFKKIDNTNKDQFMKEMRKNTLNAPSFHVESGHTVGLSTKLSAPNKNINNLVGSAHSVINFMLV